MVSPSFGSQIKKTQIIYREFPIEPPFDSADSLDATAITLLPFSEGLTLGWKSLPMLFVDGLGRDVKFLCPSLVVTGGRNEGMDPVLLYAASAFFDSKGRLLSAQSSRHLVQVGEIYDIPGLWSRFPFPIQKLKKANLFLSLEGVGEMGNPMEGGKGESQPRPHFETSVQMDSHLESHHFQTKLNPRLGKILYQSKELTSRLGLALQLDVEYTNEESFLALRQTRTKTFESPLDTLIQYAVFDAKGRLRHGGSCMGLGNLGEFVELTAFDSSLLLETDLTLLVSVWEGPPGQL